MHNNLILKIPRVVNKYEEYKKLTSSIGELKELINDPEMGEMAQLELEENSRKLNNLKIKLKSLGESL